MFKPKSFNLAFMAYLLIVPATIVQAVDGHTSIDIMSSHADKEAAKSDKHRTKLDVQIAELNRRLDDINKAIDEKNAEPTKIIIRAEPETTFAPRRTKPTKPRTPMPHSSHHIMHGNTGPQHIPPHRMAPGLMHGNPLRHHPMHLKRVRDMLKEPMHAGHPFIDPNYEHDMYLSSPSIALHHEQVMLGNPFSNNPVANLRPVQPQQKLNMHSVAKLVKSVREEVCKFNPDGSFEFAIVVSPKTGKPVLSDSGNGFVVNIKCTRGPASKPQQSSHKHIVAKSDKHKVILHRKPSDTGHAKQHSASPKHSTAHHNMMNHSHAMHKHPEHTPSHVVEAHPQEHHMINHFSGGDDGEPHRVLVHSNHGENEGLHNEINPPKPQTRPDE